MAQPKKGTSSRRTGLRRSHLRSDLAKRVNRTSPVKVAMSKRTSSAKVRATAQTESTASTKIPTSD